MTFDRDDQTILGLHLRRGVVDSIGRRGGGPGEFENGIGLFAWGDGSVLATDLGLRRLSQFDATGEFVRSQGVPGLPISIVDFDGVRAVAVWMEFTPAPEPMVGEIDLGSGEVTRWYSLFSEEIGLMPRVTDNPFAPPLLAVESDGELIVAGEGRRYRVVRVNQSGQVVAEFGRPGLDPILPTEDQIEASRELMNQQIARQPGPPPPGFRERMEESFEQPLPFFGPGAFAMGPAGRVWIATNRVANDSTAIDVFGRDGLLAATLLVRDRVMNLQFRGDRLALLVERRAAEVEGIQGIDVYRVSSQP